jgi:F420H(2)-dependent quinone reductase
VTATGVVLPASFGGRDNNPSQVHIQIRDKHFDLVARVASDEERKRYWPKLIRMYPPYRGYREATDRVIPLVVCER